MSKRKPKAPETGSECAVCASKCSDGYMCRGCLEKLSVDLADLAGDAGVINRVSPEHIESETVECRISLFDELEITYARLGRIGAEVGVHVRAAETPIPFDSRATEVMTGLRKILIQWAPAVAGLHRGDHEIDLDTVDSQNLARLMLIHKDRIRLHPEAGAIHAQIHDAVARARTLVDLPEERWYAGRCEDCDADMYGHTATRDEKPKPFGFVVCPECGRAYDIQTMREKLMTMLDEQLATAEEISRAFTMLGWSLTPERIRQWAHRGKIAKKPPMPGDHHERTRYRVGDVRDLFIQSTVK